MAPQCRACADLTLEKLVLLIDEEDYARPFNFPTIAYEHHPSFAHLEQAAEDGCNNLCRLIIDCFKGIPQYCEDLWVPELDDDVEDSMYTAAKRLDVSDVKLALGSSTSVLPTIIRGVSVLDVLMVLVGMPTDCENLPDEEGYSDKRMDYLHLILTAPRDTTTKINGVQIGRTQLDPDLASDVNHGIARGWLEECRLTHKGCMPSEPPQLPTRVVDVGTSHLDTARIIQSDGLAAEYMALSHCWGGDIPTKLTSKTFFQFQHALPQAELPANFRDAITIARQLGIRYLWIDSLCILQDSAQDWEQESQMMTKVYGNATLTLSAIAASGSSVGLLNNYSIPAPEPPAITLRIRPCDPPAYHILTDRTGMGEESLRDLAHHGPLARRGWTLQESVLSRRSLYYGVRQIYWSCSQADYAANGVNPIDQKIWQYPHITNVLHNSTAPIINESSLFEEYYDLVMDYSRRTLTHPSDKLPAIAGLARGLQPVFKTEYLAGLWFSDIHRGLLWSREVGLTPQVVPARAPSWSWAVADVRVRFKFHHPRERGWAGRGSAAMMEVKGGGVVPSEAGGGFGQVVAGQLVVETRLMELLRSEQKVPYRYGGGSISYDDSGGESHIPVVTEGSVLAVEVDYLMPTASEKDVFEMDHEAKMERGDFLMLVHADKVGSETDWKWTSTKCLVVRRVEGGKDMEFERVGMAEVISTNTTAWLDSWEKCVLTLV